MAGSVRLVLTFHNHQPVGNFDGVFEQAYRDAYLPFLDVMQDYPEIPFGLHTSGSLLEWLEPNHPEYIDRLRQMVSSSQVEIIGGAFYEPILANIPRRDRIGQIRTFTQYLQGARYIVLCADDEEAPGELSPVDSVRFTVYRAASRCPTGQCAERNTTARRDRERRSTVGSDHDR